MNRFCAFTGGNAISDSRGRYRLFIGSKPRTCAEDAKWLIELCTCDAHDPVQTWAPRKTWDAFVRDYDLYLYNAKGKRVGGWSAGRYAVDYRKPANYRGTIAKCQAEARERSAAGIYLDEISVKPFWGKNYSAEDLALWKVRVMDMARALNEPTGGGGWTASYSPCDLLARVCKPYVKHEGFRFYPRFGGDWARPGNKQSTWGTWWDNRSSLPVYGIRQMEAWGFTPIIQAIYDQKWSDEKIQAYALVAVVTGCLADRALVALMPKGESVPTWTPAHDKAMKLGEPTGVALEPKDGIWTRMYQKGHVAMNSTGKPFGNVAAHSAMIVVDR